MTTKKPNCLIVCSASSQGVSAQSFIHSFTLTQSAFNVQVATPEGKQIHFVKMDDNSRRWLNEFKTKPFSIPCKLEDIEAHRYSVLLVPSGLGSLYDLATNNHLAKCIQYFIDSLTPICVIGFGLAALFNAKNSIEEWAFHDYSLTGPSLYEMSVLPTFSEVPYVIEDFIKDNGAVYSSSKPNCMHVVIDRHLITGQNDMSTLSAVQNLILLCNARQGKK